MNLKWIASLQSTHIVCQRLLMYLWFKNPRFNFHWRHHVINSVLFHLLPVAWHRITRSLSHAILHSIGHVKQRTNSTFELSILKYCRRGTWPADTKNCITSYYRTNCHVLNNLTKHGDNADNVTKQKGLTSRTMALHLQKNNAKWLRSTYFGEREPKGPIIVCYFGIECWHCIFSLCMFLEPLARTEQLYTVVPFKY